MEETPQESQESQESQQSYGGGSLEGFGGSGSGGGFNSQGSENPFLLPTIRTPSPQPTLSYDEMKSLLIEYDILTPDDISIREDRERSVYTFKQGGVTKVMKMGNRAARNDTTKYKLLKKEHAIYQQLDALPPQQRAYFPTLYDGGDLGGMMFFLLIEYVEGQVLTDYIHEKKTSPPPVKILIELAKALEALRSINLVHGDLSTENILVTQDSVKLIDFEKTGPHRTRVNVRGSESLQIGFLYIMSLLLPKGPVYTSLEEEIRSCDPCDSFYTTAIDKLSPLVQGGGARSKGRKTKKVKGKGKGKGKKSRRLRLKGN
jgi:serine/threonine protein kinase